MRFLSAGTGDILAFVYNGEPFTMQPGSSPRKDDINLVDDDINDIKDIPFGRVQGAVVSPDGKQMAFTVRGEVFVASTEYPSVKQITHTPAIESRISWEPTAEVFTTAPSFRQKQYIQSGNQAERRSQLL